MFACLTVLWLPGHMGSNTLTSEDKLSMNLKFHKQTSDILVTDQAIFRISCKGLHDALVDSCINMFEQNKDKQETYTNLSKASIH